MAHLATFPDRRAQLREVLLHATVYSGVPAGVEALRVVSEALGA